MKKTLFILCSAGVLMTGACSSMNPNSPLNKAPGDYSKTQSYSSTSGTDVTKKTDTTVYVDENGEKHAVEKTTTTRDPEGWFNSTTSTSTKKY